MATCLHCFTEIDEENHLYHICRGRVAFVREEEMRISADQAESGTAEMPASNNVVLRLLSPADVLKNLMIFFSH